jgi:hypothetical protein
MAIVTKAGIIKIRTTVILLAVVMARDYTMNCMAFLQNANLAGDGRWHSGSPTVVYRAAHLPQAHKRHARTGHRRPYGVAGSETVT